MTKTLQQLFMEFQHEAFRFEALPTYDVETEKDALASFFAGQPLPDAFNQEWLDAVADFIAAGKSVHRIRIFADPPTLYQRFELEWGYYYSDAAGEDISICTMRDAKAALSELPPDFWVFDDEHVAVMQYDSAGAFKGATHLEVGPVRERLLLVRDKLAPYTVPLRAYLSAVRTHEGG